MAVRLDILPGVGTICRRGGVAAWVADDVAPELREQLLALLGSSDAPEGRAMLRRVAGLIVDAHDAETGIGFGVLAQEADTLAVLLHGEVSVAAERGARLTGAGSPTWVDAEIPLDGVVIVGPGTPDDLVPTSPFIVPTQDLPDGLASGGCLVVHVLAEEPEAAHGVGESIGTGAEAAAGLGATEGDMTAPLEGPLPEPSVSTAAAPADAESAASGAAVALDAGTSAEASPSDVSPFEPPSSEPLASEAGLAYEHVPTHAPPAYESPTADEPVTEPTPEPAVGVSGERGAWIAVESSTSAAPFDQALDVAPLEEAAEGAAEVAPLEQAADEASAAPPFDEAREEAPLEQAADEASAAPPFDEEREAAPFDQPSAAAPFDQVSAAPPFDQVSEAASVPNPPASVPQPIDEGWLETGDTAVTPPAPAVPPAARANENGVTSTPGAPGTAMVSAVVCELGHVNDPRLWECMVCGRAIPPQQPVTVVQPSLGVLVVDDGSVHDLDRGYVVGRAPEVAEAVQAGYVRGITVTDPEHLISRAHVEVRLEDWDVVVADLGSANGTFLWNVGDADWARLIPHQGVVLRPGGQIAFGRRSISFERALPQ